MILPFIILQNHQGKNNEGLSLVQIIRWLKKDTSLSPHLGNAVNICVSRDA
jgi:hypothetical protein